MLQVSVFVEELAEKVQHLLNVEHPALEDKRIIVTIDAQGIKTKIVVPLPKKEKKPRIETKVMKQIEEAKYALKGKRDLIYVVTLLINLANELKKLHVLELSENGKQIFTSAATEVRTNLSCVIIHTNLPDTVIKIQ